MLSGPTLTAERIASAVAELRESLGARLEDARAAAAYELRYRGQAFELSVNAGPEPHPDELVEEFAAEHERRYGYRDAERRSTS